MSASKSRKSKAVPLTILTAVALATTTACNDRREEVRDCVDAQNHIVPDGRCQTPSGSIPSGGGGGGYHYTYGGASGGNIGDTVSGGSSAPEPGAEVVSEGVARGGFGHGGGGGEGE